MCACKKMTNIRYDNHAHQYLASVHLTGGPSPPLSFNWLQLSSIPLQPALTTHLTSQDSEECSTPCPGTIFAVIIILTTTIITITSQDSPEWQCPTICTGKRWPPFSHFTNHRFPPSSPWWMSAPRPLVWWLSRLPKRVTIISMMIMTLSWSWWCGNESVIIIITCW